MATKKSVFLSDATTKWIESTTKKDHAAHDGPKWSESINATFDQFRYLMRSSLPALSMEEWQTILNVYAGCYFPAHGAPARIASDMMDDAGAVDIAELREDYAALVRKVYGMSQCEQLAILYFVQMFWSRSWAGEWLEIEQAIRAKF